MKPKTVSQSYTHVFAKVIAEQHDNSNERSNPRSLFSKGRRLGNFKFNAESPTLREVRAREEPTTSARRAVVGFVARHGSIVIVSKMTNYL